MNGRLKVFAGNSNPDLAQKVCAHLETTPGKALIGRFSDGEIRVELGESVRGRDVYVLQSTCPPVNDNLMELLVMMNAVKRASARRVVAVVPYFGYGRQEQKDKPRVSISARMVADLLTVAGADRLITFDFHADQIQGFFDIPVDRLLGNEVLLEDIRKGMKGDEVIVSPDAGGVNRARAFATRLKADLAIMDYRRAEDDAPLSSIVGEVQGRRVIILDDIIDTGETVLRTAKSAQAQGAETIDVYCVHGVLSGNALAKIDASPIRTVSITDTVPLSPGGSECAKMKTVSIARMLAEAIRRIHYDESVSSLFTLWDSTA
jgi:ribose-phosphate pyrophosphokinase